MSTSKSIALLLSLTILGAASYAALFTELGIFLVGHRFFMPKAAHASTDEESTEHLFQVLQATQYGVNQAKNWTRKHRHPKCRIRIWKLLIELAPNEAWRRSYSNELKEELGRQENSTMTS